MEDLSSWLDARENVSLSIIQLANNRQVAEGHWRIYTIFVQYKAHRYYNTYCIIWSRPKGKGVPSTIHEGPLDARVHMLCTQPMH